MYSQHLDKCYRAMMELTPGERRYLHRFCTVNYLYRTKQNIMGGMFALMAAAMQHDRNDLRCGR